MQGEKAEFKWCPQDPTARYQEGYITEAHTVSRGKYKVPEAETGLIIVKKEHDESWSLALFKNVIGSKRWF